MFRELIKKDLEDMMDKAQSLTETALEADDIVNDVEEVLERVESLEIELLETVNKKFEDLNLKLLVIELKVISLTFIASLAIGFITLAIDSYVDFEFAIGPVSLSHVGWMAIVFSIIVASSLVITLYRYLGRDFIIDLIKIMHPSLENPELNIEYTITNEETVPVEKMREVSRELDYDNVEEFTRDAIEKMRKDNDK